MLIGILGANGDVGLASVRALLSQGLDELLLLDRTVRRRLAVLA